MSLSPSLLRPGVAHLFVAHPDSLLAAAPNHGAWLSAAERAHAERYRQLGAVARYRATRVLVRGVLSGLLGRAPGELEFLEGAHGRPTLPAGTGSVDFNASRSRAWVALVVTAGPACGIDVEDVSREADVLGIARAFAPEERASLEAVAAEERRRRFFALDSFVGLPEVEGVDATGRFTEGGFTFGRAAFEARLRRARIPAADVHIVEGFYDESLAEPDRIPLERVAIAWVDCDLYSSTVPVLDYLTPRLADGAIILFDDWFCFRGDPTKGEQRACGEWLERNPGISLIPWRQFRWAGQAFIVRREDLAPDDSAA